MSEKPPKIIDVTYFKEKEGWWGKHGPHEQTRWFTTDAPENKTKLDEVRKELKANNIDFIDIDDHLQVEFEGTTMLMFEDKCICIFPDDEDYERYGYTKKLYDIRDKFYRPALYKVS